MAEEQVELHPDDQKALDRARGTTEDTNPYNDDGSLKNEAVEIPEKFKGKSLEDVVKAYTELEKKLSEKATPPPEASTEEAKTDTTKVEEKVNNVLTPKDFAKYEEAYISLGSLNEEHYKELEGKGLSKEIVDLYIEGAKARDSIYTKSLYEAAGGEEAYNELIQWAGTGVLDNSIIEDFNSKIQSGDINKAKWAIETLSLKRGTPPRKLEGGATADLGGIKAYADKSQWQKDVRNSLYGKDRKFTEMVDAKFSASKKRGTL